MQLNGRRVVQMTKYLVCGVTIFCASWMVCVSEWRAAGAWGGRAWGGRARAPPPTMRTIVAYSEEAPAGERPCPVACDRLPELPAVPAAVSTALVANDQFRDTDESYAKMMIGLLKTGMIEKVPLKQII